MFFNNPTWSSQAAFIFKIINLLLSHNENTNKAKALNISTRKINILFNIQKLLCMLLNEPTMEKNTELCKSNFSQIFNLLSCIIIWKVVKYRNVY